jgi:HRAS-like suppressor 3
MIKNNEQKRLDHNIQLLEELKLGDLVEYKRELYSHWAVYIGNGKIIHLSGQAEQKISGVGLLCSNVANVAEVRIDYFLDIIKNSYAYRNNSKDSEFTPLPPDQILTKALSKIGCNYYDLFTYNCEHFAHYCRYDLSLSDQTSRLIRFGCRVTKGLKNINNLVKDMFKKPSIEFSPNLVENPGSSSRI